MLGLVVKDLKEVIKNALSEVKQVIMIITQQKRKFQQRKKKNCEENQMGILELKRQK